MLSGEAREKFMSDCLRKRNKYTQRCTVHKHRNLLDLAPDQLHEEVSADYTDIIYAAKKVEERRRPSCASGG
jgi:transposase-like protein